MKAHERSRLGVGYVPQGRGILPGLTALENLRLAWTADSGDTEPAAIERDRRHAAAPRLDPRPQGRRALGRRAADPGARPRPHRRAVAAPARRAVGRHPAVDRAGDRRDPGRLAQARQALARRRRAEPRPRPRRRRPHRRDGARPDRARGRRAHGAGRRPRRAARHGDDADVAPWRRRSRRAGAFEPGTGAGRAPRGAAADDIPARRTRRLRSARAERGRSPDPFPADGAVASGHSPR